MAPSPTTRPDSSRPWPTGETTTDTFTYTISDGNGGTNTATVTIEVTGVNDAPTAANDGSNWHRYVEY